MGYIELNGVHRNEYLITMEDIDPEYRLKLTSALAYFQNSVAAFMTDRRIAAFDIRPKGYMWVIAEISMKVSEDAPIWRERITSEVKVSELTSSRAYFDFCLRRNSGEIYASGTGIWTPIDHATGRPVHISDLCEVRGTDNVVQSKHPKMKFESSDDLISENEHITTMNDMDFNKHVGNRSYVNYAVRDFPADFAETHYVSSLAIKFIRQTFVGDTLISRCFRIEGNGLDYLVRMGFPSGDEACILRLGWEMRMRPTPVIGEMVRRH